MEQLICCSIKVQPARSGPRHLAAPRKEFPSPQRTPGSEAGVCPPLAAKRREPPFDGCVPSNECSASSQRPETPRCAAKRNPSPQRTPGSEAGVCPPLADKRREPPFDGCVPSNECSASPEWLETLSAPRKEFPHRSASQGSEAGVCPPLADKRREPPFDGCVPSNECSASPEGNFGLFLLPS